ncbi:hypothetical protein SNE40_007706 [Patella caerulea]|uniref:Uncharacterized protein n=1 Tax=Patella caerulea TaxID=87958 RepID=A0AAN8JZ42_PATCE
MSEVPSLHSAAIFACTQSLLKLFDDHQDEFRHRLISVFASDDYGVIGHNVLQRIVEYYPEKLTDSILLALVQESIKVLNLKKCINVTGCNILKALQKSKQLTSLDLSECEKLMLPALFGAFGNILLCLTVINISKCRTVNNALVQSLLRNTPCLHDLNLSECNELTDEAFLLDLEVQDKNLLGLETDVPGSYHRSTNFSLKSINISSCDRMTSLAVANICAFAGLTLQNINMAYSNISSLCLLYLSGYSLVTVYVYMMSCTIGSDFEDSDITHDQIWSLQSKYHIDSVNERKERDKENLCECLNYVKQKVKDKYYAFVSEDQIDIEITEQMDKQCSSCSNLISHQEEEPCQRLPVSCMSSNQKISLTSDEQFTAEMLCNVHSMEDLDNDSTGNDNQNKHIVMNQNSSSNLKKSVPETDHKIYLPPNKRAYISSLQFVNILCIASEESLDTITFPIFFACNKKLIHLSINWPFFTGEFVDQLVDSQTCLQELLLPECNSMSDEDIMKLCKLSHKLKKIDLTGIFMLNDIAVNRIITDEIQSLSLSECSITDLTLKLISRRAASAVKEIDLAWCEEITDEGINALMSSCSALQNLNLHHCSITEKPLFGMAEKCRNICTLSLSSIKGISDQAVIELAKNPCLLEEIDISWNTDITDVGIEALFKYSKKLKIGIFSGNKRITSQPMYCLVTDLEAWRKSQLTKTNKRIEKMNARERNVENVDDISSDEEDEIYLPRRSTVYGPNLKRIEVDYVDFMDDALLSHIVAFCFGSLEIMDYYSEAVQPAKLTVKRGRLYNM